MQYLLGQAGAAMRLAMERGLSDLGLTPPQYAILTMIDAYPGISGADLARLTRLTPPTISVIVRNLLRDGMITKAPDPEKGRVLRLFATREGKNMRARGRIRAVRVEASLAEGLSPAEETIVRTWLARLAERSGES